MRAAKLMNSKIKSESGQKTAILAENPAFYTF